MCGRFCLTEPPLELLDYFGLVCPEAFAPRKEIFPGQPVLALLLDAAAKGAVRAEEVQWGLVPAWAKEETIGRRMFNARIETLREKPAFRDAARHRRCLIPASGYYEWESPAAAEGAPPSRKIRHYFASQEGGPFVFAGIWERWRGRPDGTPLLSTAIVTTAARGPAAAIHDRMPLALPYAAWQVWLREGHLPE